MVIFRYCTLFVLFLTFGSNLEAQEIKERRFGTLIGTGLGYTIPGIGTELRDYYENVEWRGRVSAHVRLLVHGRFKKKPRIILLSGIIYQSLSYREAFTKRSPGGIEFDRKNIIQQHYLAPTLGIKVFLTETVKVKPYASSMASPQIHIRTSLRGATLGSTQKAEGFRPVNFSFIQAFGFQMKRINKASFYLEIFHNWLVLPIGSATDYDTGVYFFHIGLSTGFTIHKIRRQTKRKNI